MNTLAIKIIAAIVGITAVGGGVWYANSSHKASDTAAAPVAQETVSTNVSATTSGTTSDTSASATSNSPEELAKKGGQFMCTFNITSASADSSGTIYIDGKKFHGDFKSNVKAVGMTIESHSVSDGAYAYSWTSSSPVGFKVAVTPSTSPYGAMSGSASVNGANTNWNCNATSFGADKFVVPSNIQFMEAPKK